MALSVNQSGLHMSGPPSVCRFACSCFWLSSVGLGVHFLVRPSVRPCFSVWLSIRLGSGWLSDHPSVCVSVFLSVCPPLFLCLIVRSYISVRFSVRPCFSVWLSVRLGYGWLSDHPLVYVSVFLSVCLSAPVSLSYCPFALVPVGYPVIHPFMCPYFRPFVRLPPTPQHPKSGAVLVFLPGMAEIMTLHEHLRNHTTFSPKKTDRQAPP